MEGNRGSVAKYHVLIADDDPEIVSMLLDCFKEDVAPQLPGGCATYGAREGIEAIRIAKERLAEGTGIGLAIMDLLMPGKSGRETIDELLQLEPSPKIVVLSATAYFHAEWLKKMYGDKITIVAKPIRMKELANIAAATLLGKSTAGNYVQQLKGLPPLAP
ncbi:response regulator [Candidatus Woesearchaeota archaeon]|nr:response regulator [Candidatus Woesearchaeota archaeon]